MTTTAAVELNANIPESRSAQLSAERQHEERYREDRLSHIQLTLGQALPGGWSGPHERGVHQVLGQEPRL